MRVSTSPDVTAAESRLIADRGNAFVWLGPLLVFAALAAVVASGFDRGWLPHDDGYLAMSAERVIEGETPHLDFDEIYTGGLTYLNAWALDTLGMNLAALRLPYLVVLAGFTLSVYLICRRFFNRLQSALISSAVVFLGPYSTSSPTPSSYTVFLAGIALLSVLKYYESRAARWVLLAGAVSGIGVLAKSTGLYLILGLGIGLIGFHARERSSGVDPVGRVLLVSAALLVTAFVSTQFTVSRFIGLALPVWLLVVLVVQLRSPHDSDRTYQTSSLNSLSWYSLGVAAPLVLYGGVLASQGALDETLAGLVAIPSLFVGNLIRDVSSVVTLAVPVVIGFILWRLRGPLSRIPNRSLMVATGTIGLAWFFVHPRSEFSILLLVFSWAPTLLPMFAIGLKKISDALDTEPIILTTISCAVCMQLVRFPTSNVWYIFYSLPLAVVGFMILMGRREWPRRSLAVAGLITIAGLVALAGHQGRIFSSGNLGASVAFIPLEGERAGLQVPVFYDYYNDLQGEPAMEARTILAGPDTPEIYFLFDIPSYGRSVFPLISEAYGEAETMLDAWTRIEPDTVVVNTAPANSELEPAFVAAVEASCEGPRAFGLLDLFTDCRG